MKLTTRITELLGIEYPIVQGGMMWVGQIQGLIHDIPSCEVLVKRIVLDAIEVIQSRLNSAVAS